MSDIEKSKEEYDQKLKKEYVEYKEAKHFESQLSWGTKAYLYIGNHLNNKLSRLSPLQQRSILLIVFGIFSIGFLLTISFSKQLSGNLNIQKATSVITPPELADKKYKVKTTLKRNTKAGTDSILNGAIKGSGSKPKSTRPIEDSQKPEKAK